MTAGGSKRRIWAGGIVLGSLVAGLAAWGVAVKSPLFAVREIRVEGNVRLAAEEVIREAGVREGSNLLTLSVAGAVRAVEGNPWVARLQVERELPSTLVLRVEERTPIAWVGNRAGGVIVAADGTVLARREEPRRLAVVDGTPAALSVGDRASALGEQLRALAALRPRVRRLVESTELRESSLTLHLRDGSRAILGPPVNLGRKSAAIESILRWVGERDLALDYLDVRSPGTPAVRPLP